jgi:CarD family transcriptional regulator
MYAIGSKVVHPAYGAGEIVRITEKTIGEHSARYYVIDMTAVPHTTQVMVPVRRANDMGLREVGQAEGLRAILACCADAPRDSDINRDYRSRHSDMSENLKSGDFEQVADTVRTLYYMDQQRPLGMSEKEVLRQGKDILASELALASDQALDTAMQELEELLAQMLPA